MASTAVGDEMARLIGNAVSAGVNDAIGALGQAVIAFGNSRTSQQLLRFAEDFGTPPSDAALATAHREIGKLMQASTISAYGQAKAHFRHAKYDPQRPRIGRTGGRDSGGLDRALRSPGLWESDARGIRFGIIKNLDKEARHWARMNFGSGEIGAGSNAHFSLRFSNLAAIEFPFVQKARSAAILPRGVWKEGAFYLARDIPGSKAGFTPQVKSVLTKGNVGYNFIDTGIARFFKEAPGFYGRIIKATQYTGGRPVGITGAGRGTKESHNFTVRG